MNPPDPLQRYSREAVGAFVLLSVGLFVLSLTQAERLVLTQTAVMLWWGALITALVLAAMLPWFAGLLVVGPVIGHASWHAYVALVDASALPERPLGE